VGHKGSFIIGALNGIAKISVETRFEPWQKYNPALSNAKFIPSVK
jgi:hypothetical protein